MYRLYEAVEQTNLFIILYLHIHLLQSIVGFNFNTEKY